MDSVLIIVNMITMAVGDRDAEPLTHQNHCLRIINTVVQYCDHSADVLDLAEIVYAPGSDYPWRW